MSEDTFAFTHTHTHRVILWTDKTWHPNRARCTAHTSARPRRQTHKSLLRKRHILCVRCKTCTLIRRRLSTHLCHECVSVQVLVMSGSRVWEISECEELTNFIEGFFELLQILSGNLHETMRHCGFGSVYLKETETHARVHTHVRHHHECKCLQKKQKLKKLLKNRSNMLV